MITFLESVKIHSAVLRQDYVAAADAVEEARYLSRRERVELLGMLLRRQGGEDNLEDILGWLAEKAKE